ncbi:hypothetical protein [Actinoallomurus iriomotensis]|uniref:hypothetical protein n=1 Tax=Actinoallomurus iriomotensis TaxID=478107 RepID=UPI0025574C57|nr:hypothetical protein [Actinoallomurus iriomotensis]
MELRAWQALLDGEYAEAVEICQAGIGQAAPFSSASARLTAQKARAWARVRDGVETHRTLNDAAEIVSRLPVHLLSCDGASPRPASTSR